MIIITIDDKAQYKLLKYAETLQRINEYEWGPYSKDRKTPEKQVEELIFGALYEKCGTFGSLIEHIDFMHELSDAIKVDLKVATKTEEE